MKFFQINFLFLKKNIFVAFFVCISSNLFSQAPAGINYQAVIRNSSGTLVASTNVAIRVQIRQSTATGTVVYQERHSVLTSTKGCSTTANKLSFSA